MTGTGLLPSQPPDSIALVCNESPQFDEMTQFLRRAVREVALTEQLRGIRDYSSFALVAVHFDALAPEEQDDLVANFMQRSGRPVLLLLSEKFAEKDLERLLGAHVLTNMLVINESGFDISDFLVTIQKIRHGDIFGLEKYFLWGIEPRIITVTESTQKNSVLDAICNYASAIGVAPRLRTSIRTVADEFVTNAVYNAPVSANGAPLYSGRSRLEPVHLGPGEEVTVRFCCYGRRFGLSTMDRFGSLNPQRLQDYLARAFRRGTDQVSETGAGAGLGFYEILDSASHFVVNIEPGVRTEMIGLVDVSGSYKRFAKSGKSFNIFVKERSS